MPAAFATYEVRNTMYVYMYAYLSVNTEWFCPESLTKPIIQKIIDGS